MTEKTAPSAEAPQPDQSGTPEADSLTREQSYQDDTQRLQGVFSMKKSARIGAGTTSRKVWQTTYFFAQENEDGKMEVQALSPNNMPFGPKKTLTKEQLLKDYLPEPAKFQKEVLPQMREARKLVARGDRYRKRGESFSAEYEYNNALSIDEENIRANFGIGLCYLERGEKEKAHEVFERVVEIDGAFEQQHKHLFNDFGINLRKTGMYQESVEYYEKALVLTRSDENLHYNIARAAYELSDLKKTVAHLKACLSLNKKHPEARKFIEFLKRKREKEAAKKAKLQAQAEKKTQTAAPKKSLFGKKAAPKKQAAPKGDAKKDPSKNLDLNLKF